MWVCDRIFKLLPTSQSSAYFTYLLWSPWGWPSCTCMHLTVCFLWLLSNCMQLTMPDFHVLGNGFSSCVYFHQKVVDIFIFFIISHLVFMFICMCKMLLVNLHIMYSLNLRFAQICHSYLNILTPKKKSILVLTLKIDCFQKPNRGVESCRQEAPISVVAGKCLCIFF